MKMIIDIPDYNLDDVQNGSIACGQILKAVKNGMLISTGGDLISREDLKTSLNFVYDCAYIESKSKEGIASDIIEEIDNAPTVDAIVNTVEVRPKGEWIKWNFKTFGAMGDWEYKCSNCEKVYGGEHNFCPNCGAQMQKII